jgi:hypothetical protein
MPAGKAAMQLRYRDLLHRSDISENDIFIIISQPYIIVYIDSIIRNARGRFPELASVHVPKFQNGLIYLVVHFQISILHSAIKT